MMWLFLIVCVICATLVILVRMLHPEVKAPENVMTTEMRHGYEPPSMVIPPVGTTYESEFRRSDPGAN